MEIIFFVKNSLHVMIGFHLTNQTILTFRLCELILVKPVFTGWKCFSTIISRIMLSLVLRTNEFSRIPFVLLLLFIYSNGFTMRAAWENFSTSLHSIGMCKLALKFMTIIIRWLSNSVLLIIIVIYASWNIIKYGNCIQYLRYNTITS